MFIADFWLPILVAAVAVFVASSVIHMVFKWHASDYHGFSNEEAVRAAMSPANAVPGKYFVPHCADMKDLAKPEMQKKFIDGPVAIVTVRRPGPPSMGTPLG